MQDQLQRNNTQKPWPQWTFAWKSLLGSILNSNFFVNSCSSDAHNIRIMEVITTYIHYSAGADELAIMHGNTLEDFFVNPFSSALTIMQDITMYMYMYVLWYRCCLKKQNTHSGTVGFAPESIMNHNCFINPFTSEDY